MKKTLLTFITLLFVSTTFAQVGIGTTSPEGALDIVSTNDTGVVIPRVSSIDNVTDGQGNPPANGTLVYDLSKNAICFYLNQKWACMEFNLDGSVGVNGPVYYESQDTYIKASNTQANQLLGYSIALSADGNTLAVGAIGDVTNPTDPSHFDYGAVYVYSRSGALWSQQAIIYASNADESDSFGFSITLSDDGETLAVSSPYEGSNATGINGDQLDNSLSSAGAAYVFTRLGNVWSQEAYIKASNTDTGDLFGYSIALNGDGNTMAVSARDEDSNATGINGDQTDNSASSAGAVFVFSRAGSVWSQEAYIKSSNTDISDRFGESIDLNLDGNTLIVGAPLEESDAVGINGDQTNNNAARTGAVYVFIRTGSVWSQQAYIKSSNPDVDDRFGIKLAIDGSGNTIAVAARNERSNAIGVNGDETDNSAGASGAVYVFTRIGATWSQQAYVKSSNTDLSDTFGNTGLALSQNGNTLSVGAIGEDSNATGINGDQTDNSVAFAGAIYVFTRVSNNWSQIAYVKATNTAGNDRFGGSAALSGDGSSIAIGAYLEDSNATGINGNQTDNSLGSSGAVYVYEN